MSSQQRIARAFLTMVEEPDDDTLRRLVATHGPVDIAELVADAADQKRDWELGTARRLDHARVRGLRFLVPDDEEWPVTLTPAVAPLGLWVRGDGSLGQLRRRAVVILGAVAPTPFATHVAYRMASELGDAG